MKGDMKGEGALPGGAAYYRCLNEFYPGSSQELQLLACGVENCAPEKQSGPRRRPGYHLYVVLSGEGEIETESGKTHLCAGEMFLIRPEEMFEFRADAVCPWTLCWMSFDGHSASSFMETAGFGEGVSVMSSAVPVQKFSKLCSQVLAHPELTQSGAVYRAGVLAQYIALALESREEQQTPAPLNPQLDLRGNYIDHAVIFMQNNYSRIQVVDISNYLNINRSYFSVLFTEKMGISPGNYLFRIRMKKGTEMLEDSPESLQYIAEYVGYENAMAFSKAFKRCYGISPKVYRRLPSDKRPAPMVELPEWKNRISTSESENPA